MSNTLVSVITVSYNSSKTIKDTLDSILRQTYKNIEYIVIDGNSTDNTVSILESYEPLFKKTNISFSWVSEPDKGIYDAFNKGVKLSKGKWISFLGSDDIYLDNAVELYFNEIKNLQNEVDYIHSMVKVESKKTIKDKWKWSKFKRKMNISHVGCFHNQNYFKKFGLFDDSLKIAGDYEILLRKKQNLKTHYFDKLTVIMGSSGVSNSLVIKTYKETTEVKNKHKTQSVLKNKLDYSIWLFKLFVKRTLYAIIR